MWLNKKIIFLSINIIVIIVVILVFEKIFSGKERDKIENLVSYQDSISEDSSFCCIDSIVQKRARHIREVLHLVDTSKIDNAINRKFIDEFPKSFKEFDCLFGTHFDVVSEGPRTPKWSGGDYVGPLSEEYFSFLEIYRALHLVYPKELVRYNVNLVSNGYWGVDAINQLGKIVREDLMRRPDDYLLYLSSRSDSIAIGFWKFLIEIPLRLERRRRVEAFKLLIEEAEPHSSRLEQAFDELNVDWGDLIDTVRLSKDIDSVEVTCLMFGESRNKSFTLNFSEIYFNGGFRHSDKKKFVISSLEKRNRFVNYINQFYIEKEKIIFSKKKTDYITATDYPRIIVKLFQKGDLVLKQKNQIGSESHKIEYNPKFIEFYEFLDGLAEK